MTARSARRRGVSCAAGASSTVQAVTEQSVPPPVAPPRDQAGDVVGAVFHAAAAEFNVALLVVELGDEGRPTIRWSNPGVCKLLGLASSDLDGNPLAELLTGLDDLPLNAMFRRERSTTTSAAVRTAIGETVACVITASPSPEGDLWALQLHRAHSDLERALRASVDAHERRFRVLAERSPVPTMLSEQGMRLGHVNDALCTLLGATSDKLVGTGWMAHAHDEDLDLITDTVVAVLGGDQREIQARFVDSSQRLHFTDMRFTPIHTPGVGDGFLATLEDTTERRAFEEQLNHQATHDPLTGLPRRNKLWDHIASAMRDPEARLACLFLDLDNFKIVNDSLGHNAGDALLVEVANRLAKVMRGSDLVARFGGDEFVVASETGSLDAALSVADRILKVLSEPVVLDSVEIRPKGSIGVVLRGPEHCTPDDIIRDCDIAMYQAKSRGKGRIMVLDENIRSAAYDTLMLVSELRQAIEQGRIGLSYQPIVRRHGDRAELMSVEALARWQHSERGSVSPEVFVKLAEENGLVHELGQLVLDEACATMARWQRRLGPLAPPRVNVNLSALQMGDYQLVQTVRRTLERYGLRPEQLCLEITESALMKEPDTAALIVTQLREHGVEMAIDDFGTGFSSLAYLRRLPVNYIKMDRCFVAELEDGHTAVADTVIALGRNLGMDVVAEGVETEHQARVLERLGCSLLQGFGISKPLCEPDFVEWRRSSELASTRGTR